MEHAGDDRVSGTDADRHDDISRNGSSGFGGIADSAETGDLVGKEIGVGKSARLADKRLHLSPPLPGVPETMLILPPGAGSRMSNLRARLSNAQHDQRYKSDAREQHYERDGVVFEPMPITGKHHVTATPLDQPSQPHSIGLTKQPCQLLFFG